MTSEIFNTVAMPKIPMNQFDLSHEIKTSFRIGELIPTCVIDVLPGDVFRITPETMLRFAPMIAPVMHRMDVYQHFFFVPYRILWDGFEDFITGSSDVIAPYISVVDGEAFNPGSIADYMGVPIDAVANGEQILISPFPFAAFRKIYDEYYRDQNLEVAEIFVPLVPGNNNSSYGLTQVEDGVLLRSLEHDYFTSALPFAQKGDPVTLPLTFQTGIPVTITPDFPAAAAIAVDVLTGSPITAAGNLSNDATTGLLRSGTGPGTNMVIDPNGSLVVDIQSDAVTLDTLRTAIVLQEFLERDARSGTRYTEKIQGQFGVRSSDARLQRPEYIGGSKQVCAISEVLSTAQSSNDPSSADQFVGQMAGHGISVDLGHTFTYRAEEHGVIIGIISVLPETAYQQGVHRMWSKFDTVEDFAWPAFGNLGEQMVKKEEIFFGTLQPGGEWGYQSRYAEYKSMPSRVSGEMRSNSTYPLDFWHLAMFFDSEPFLNNDFIKADPTKFDRIFAVQEVDVDHLYARLVYRINALRKLPRFGIPSFGSTNMGG